MIKLNKITPTKTFIGIAEMNGIKDTFEFECPETADEDEIFSEMVNSFWESGIVNLWCEEKKK